MKKIGKQVFAAGATKSYCNLSNECRSEYVKQVKL